MIVTFTAALATTDAAPTSDKQRTITGLVVPWNSTGHASLGGAATDLTVKRGALALPDDLGRVKLYRDHSTTGGTPVGYATAARETDAGLEMTFAVSSTDDGEAALKDVTERVRDALSVEVIETEITGGELTAGQLTAVALVAIPAFSEARVTNVTAAQATNEENKLPSNQPAKVPPGTLTAANKEPATLTADTAAAALVAARTGAPLDTELTAALADIKRSANPNISAPAWLGEVWSGIGYTREIVPTMTIKSLTGMRATGFRWVTKPAVADYDGDKKAVPSNTPTTEAVELSAKRLAGAHDIDRAYFDFNEAEFIQGYFRAMAESYAMVTDTKAAEFLVAEAKKNKVAGKQSDVLRAAAKARQQIKKDTRAEATTFLVHPDDMFALLDITMMDEPRYLELIGVKPENFVATEQVPSGTVVAYTKPAVEFYELPGSPIRVEAEDIAKGGRDSALFGYYATFVAHPKGIVAVEFGEAD